MCVGGRGRGRGEGGGGGGVWWVTANILVISGFRSQVTKAGADLTTHLEVSSGEGVHQHPHAQRAVVEFHDVSGAKHGYNIHSRHPANALGANRLQAPENEPGEKKGTTHEERARLFFAYAG